MEQDKWFCWLVGLLANRQLVRKAAINGVLCIRLYNS